MNTCQRADELLGQRPSIKGKEILSKTLQKATENYYSITPKKTMEIYSSGKNGNSVNRIGHLRDDSSLGRDSHVPQVRLDRFQATVGIPNKTAIKLATSNVRTLFQC